MRKFKLLPSILIGSLSILCANENYLSQTKQDILNYSYDKATEDSNKLKNDWINPITYQYIYSNTETLNMQIVSRMKQLQVLIHKKPN